MGREYKINEKTDKTLNKAADKDAETNFYLALGHKIRRRIITIIGENNYSSFTNLKKELDVSTGTIYHHLDALSGLIEQGKNKKYRLTDLGIYAYNSLKNNMKSISPVLSKKIENKFLRRFSDFTAKLFVPIGRKYKIYTLIISLTVILIGTFFSALNSSFSFLLFFFNGFQDGNLAFMFQFLFSLSFLFNYFIYFVFVEGLCRFLYKKKENSLNLFRSFAINFIPIIAYQIYHFIFLYTGLVDTMIFNFIDRILMIFFQVLSLWILSHSLKLIKGMKMENGLIVALLIQFIGFSFILLISL